MEDTDVRPGQPLLTGQVFREKDMTEPSTFVAQKVHYELRFTSFSSARRGYAFPCDQIGHVDIDELTDRGRTDYFYARAVVGKELRAPVVEPVPNAGLNAE